MEQVIIHDLDKLRPPAAKIVLASNEIDITFISAEKSIDFLKMQNEVVKLRENNTEEGAKESYKISAKICALITADQYPDMTWEWLMVNCTLTQLTKLIEIVTDAILNSINADYGDGEVKKKKRRRKRLK